MTRTWRRIWKDCAPSGARGGSEMDKQLVSAKLESLRRALVRVRQRTPTIPTARCAALSRFGLYGLKMHP